MIDKRTTHAGQARYEVRLRGIDGKERSRTFRTRREAESYERAQRTSMEHGLWVDPRGGKVTLASWTAEWERTVVHLRASTRRIYDVNLRRHILPELGQVELAKLTPSVLRAWLSGLTVKAGAHGGVLSPASVAQIYRTLNRVLVAAVENELLGRNPLQGVKPPATPVKPMRFLTHDEVARLGEEIDPRYQALLLVAAYCGLRAGELIALRRSNVDLDHRTITVVEQVQCLHGRFEVLPPKTAAGRRSGAPAPARHAALLRLAGHRRRSRREGAAAHAGPRLSSPHPRPLRPSPPRPGRSRRRPTRPHGPPGPLRPGAVAVSPNDVTASRLVGSETLDRARSPKTRL